MSVGIPNDEISIIRQRVLDLMLWSSKENLTAVIEDALTYTHRLNSSCYWPDVDYYNRGVVDWRTAEHMFRISTMLQALTRNGSIVQNNSQIRSAVHCALDVWLINDWLNPNWWWNEIEIPLFTTGSLLMLGENATDFQVEKITEISFRSAWWLNRTTDVGANLAWMIQVELYRSLATRNLTGIEQGFRRMWADVAIQSVDQVGIQFDWSYHFHGTQLYSGVYGMFWAQNIFGFLACSEQTSYAMNDTQLEIFARFIIQGDAWMIVDRFFDWNVLGRVVSRPDQEDQVSFDTPLIRRLADIINSNETRIQLINLADRLDARSNAALLLGNKHFFNSDYQVHRRMNWTATIKMQSIRTQPIECINGEDKKGEHSGQGVLNLYTDHIYNYEHIFPLLDWQAINGITVEHDIPLEPCNGISFQWKNVSFVGGVSDGYYGLAMMDTASHNFTAQRSWHFYDDAIIALATNLTLTTATTAWTTLASRLLPTGQITIGFFNSTVITVSDGNYSFFYSQEQTSNVQWIHVGDADIACLLQSQQQYESVGIELGTKTGNYHDIGPSNSTVTARLLTIWNDVACLETCIVCAMGEYNHDILMSKCTVSNQYTIE